MKSGWGGQPPPSSPSDGAPAKAREARKFFSIVKPLFWILLYSGLIHRILPHLLGCTCTIMGRARPFPNEVATPMTKLNPHKVRQKFCNFWEFLWKIFAIFCIKRVENGKFIWSKINKNKVAYTIIGIPPKNYFLFFTKIFFISKKIIPPPSTHPIMLEILPTTETPHRAPNPSLHVSTICIDWWEVIHIVAATSNLCQDTFLHTKTADKKVNRCLEIFWILDFLNILKLIKT